MPATSLDLPFQPIRSNLYSSRELMDAYDPNDPTSMGRTLDFKSYRYFTVAGGAAPKDPYAGMMEALHDNSIMRAMTTFLSQAKRPTVAIMGGHGERRDTANFAIVVEIARKLTRSGCLVASGGGPGAMEATHLGALLADAPDSEVARAVDRLKTYPKLPQNTIDVVADDGTVNETILGELHAWAKPAYEIGVENAERGGTSLAIPTWYYGHEPISPLASHVAKYFQNSIREDVLLAMAANGIIYTQGAAGTLQEVFQDAAQNFYRKSTEPFAPMVFFGKDFWTTKLPAVALLKALFTSVGKMTESEFGKYVVITDSVDEAVGLLMGNSPSEEKTARRMVALGFGPIMEASEASLRADA